MAEQRYRAVLAVIGDGRSITEVPASWGISRQTLHTWLARWEREGLEGLVDRSHRPVSCPHQLQARVEVLEARRAHPGWGPGQISHELGRRGLVVSVSATYRALRRAELIEPDARRRRAAPWEPDPVSRIGHLFRSAAVSATEGRWGRRGCLALVVSV